MNTIQAVSARVIQLMNKRDWSAYRLAFESGVPTSTVSNIILGKCKPATSTPFSIFAEVSAPNRRSSFFRPCSSSKISTTPIESFHPACRPRKKSGGVSPNDVKKQGIPFVNRLFFY